MGDDKISVISTNELSIKSPKEDTDKVSQSSVQVISEISIKEPSDDVSINSAHVLPVSIKPDEVYKTSDIMEHVQGASSWHLLHILTILALFALVISPISLIPRHNSILCPEYWYEIDIPVVIAMFFSSTTLIINCHVFINRQSLTSVSVILKIWLMYVTGFIVPSTVSYIVWSIYLQYNHPMPLLGLCYLISWIFVLCSTWFIFPSQLLHEDAFREKLKTFMLYSLWWLVMNIQRVVLTIVFKNISIYVQWIFALMIPCLREGNKRLLCRLVHKMAGSDDERANVLVGINVNVYYALFSAINLSGGEIATVISMVAVDFLLHLKLTYNYIQLQNQVEEADVNKNKELKTDKKKTIMKLVLAEMCEGMVPLCYAIGYCMIYYGPNSGIFGNVGISIWGYKKVEDVQWLFIILFLLFSIDTLSVAVNAYCLRIFCGFNIVQEFARVLKQYWFILFVQLTQNVWGSFAMNDINLGMDTTLRFQWITDEGRRMLVNNSTQLLELETMC